MLKLDCRHFPGDRPCNPHKETGVKCDDCTYYQPIQFKILIIKLDAVGDVLRTTSILNPLKKKYPDSCITWCTKSNSKELFKYNLLVDEVIEIEDDALFRIKAESYDLVINLDTSKISSAIAANAAAKVKIGFVLNEKGYVEATSSTSHQWLEMSAFDDVKRANTKTYQQIMYEILDLDFPVKPPTLSITDAERNKIKLRKFYKEIDPDSISIGLNIGIGTKWPSKGWPLKNWKKLISKLEKDKFNLLLLGGPEEKAAAADLLKEYNILIDTGCDNSLLEFTAIVEICDLIITADTLALHIATALDKQIMALFGPTSLTEIELYGKGTKLISTDGCECFYMKHCKEDISCMEKISAEMVIEAMNSRLEKIKT